MRGSRRRSSICSTRGSTRGFRRATSRRRRLPPQSRRGLRRYRCSTRTASSAISSTRCSRRSAPIFISLAMTAGRSSRSRSSIASRKLDGVPRPTPLYEIFVYSPRVEGVHLRFGKVARGGIRWSDRPQDFRTEVLGLVKAQQVKNAVIVPVGSKGGYVPKHLPVGGPREAIQAEGTAAYKIFISTLLDITDNLDLKEVLPPENVVRHDDDDPYLVVAADKGTATFSDIANGISEEHKFWLGDAFASGGSAGYDHKGMGITARGAWESVKRHFREMDIDISKTPFTAVGVGDMSGDVFGNGMLREKTTKLRRGLRPSRHLHRSRSRPGQELRRAQAAVRSAALELAGLRQEADFQGRRRIPAVAEGNRAVQGGAEGDRLRQGQGDAAGGDERDPEGAGRSAVLRRHRHLHPRIGRNRRGGGRPRQRRDPHHRRAGPRQGDRRGRQSRHDPARPHRHGARRRAAQHRRDRQLGGRQHVGRRGQHQDRAEPAGARRASHDQGAQHAARQDDR